MRSYPGLYGTGLLCCGHFSSASVANTSNVESHRECHGLDWDQSDVGITFEWAISYEEELQRATGIARVGSHRVTELTELTHRAESGSSGKVETMTARMKTIAVSVDSIAQ